MNSMNTPGNGGSSASTPFPAGSTTGGSSGMSSSSSSASGMSSSGMDSGASQQRAKENIDRIASSAHDTVDRLSARAASMADRMGSSGTQYYDQTREYVVANPMRTLGIAVLAGFLLGRLMR